MSERLEAGDRVDVFVPGTYSFSGVVIEADNASPIDTPMVRVEMDRGAAVTERPSYWVNEGYCRKVEANGTTT